MCAIEYLRRSCGLEEEEGILQEELSIPRYEGNQRSEVHLNWCWTLHIMRNLLRFGTHNMTMLQVIYFLMQERVHNRVGEFFGSGYDSLFEEFYS